jgi:hypothetical protein
MDREIRGAERVEVAIDRPDADAETLGKLLGRDPCAPGSERFGDGEKSFSSLHGRNLT